MLIFLKQQQHQNLTLFKHIKYLVIEQCRMKNSHVLMCIPTQAEHK